MYQTHVAEVDPQAVRLTIADRWQVPQPRPTVTIVHALPKGRKLDDVVQRLVEIGIDRLVPAHSARSEVRLDERKAARAAVAIRWAARGDPWRRA